LSKDRTPLFIENRLREFFGSEFIHIVADLQEDARATSAVFAPLISFDAYHFESYPPDNPVRIELVD
jgi:hypothetical protein